MIQVICSDNYEWLKRQKSNTFDSCVTDSPYGLGEAPDPMAVMQSWCWKGYHEVEGKGFMGKKWDSFVAQPLFWKEMFRVLKPGAHVLCFFGTRTYDWGVMAMRFAGFEIRDCIQWLYGSGFPKGKDISKEIDRQAGAEREIVGQKVFIGNNDDSENFGKNRTDGKGMGFKTGLQDVLGEPATDAAKQWDGWNTALKPANEPIVLARKPLESDSIAQNVLRYGTGGINVKDTAIGLEERFNQGGSENRHVNILQIDPNYEGKATIGRWPANVILTHHPDCKQVGTRIIKEGQEAKPPDLTKWGESTVNNKTSVKRGGWDRGEEEIEVWECHDDCPVKILDQQSGVLTSGSNCIRRKEGSFIEHGGLGKSGDEQITYGDSGGASRFFKTLNYDICENVNFVEKNLSLQNQVEDFVLKLVAIEESQEDKQLKNITIAPFMQEIRKKLKKDLGTNTATIQNSGIKCLQELKLTIMEMLKDNHVKFAEIQRLTNIMMIIQNLMNIDGFVENIISNIMLTNMVLGEKDLIRFKYCAKASTSEREFGLDDFESQTFSYSGSDSDREGDIGLNKPKARKNIHPTVKPIGLMRYLVKLITPKGGHCIDPFAGSCTTGIACKLEGMDCTLIDNDEYSCKTGEARIKAYIKQDNLFDF